MQKRFRFSLVMLGVFAFATVRGQQLDTVLQEVKVKTKKKRSGDAKVNEFSPGQRVKQIDAATLQQYQQQSLASLLAQQEPVFIKSYGINGLATLSLRGASTAQSAVLWNGVPLQNAALGVADISAIPVALMNNVSIAYGSSAAMWGSGNVGGALLLEDEPAVFRSDSGRGLKMVRLDVNAGGGSYNQYMGGASAALSGRRVWFSVKAFGQSAVNDLPYTTNAGQTATLQHAKLGSGSVLLRSSVRMSQYQVMNVSLWLQQYDRQIPPALFEAASARQQTDASVRFYADVQRQRGTNAAYGKVSFIEDVTAYTDDAIQVRTDNRVWQAYAEAGWRHRFAGAGQLLVFAPLSVSALAGKGDSAKQEKAALAAAWEVKVWRERLDIAVSLRSEVADGKFVALPGVNGAYHVNDWLALRLNGQRTYRLPALNELYYFPGGNKSLKPEEGWSADAGYAVRARMGRVHVVHDLSVFDREIDNWIYWVGGAIWTPHNLARVHSRGVETENHVSYNAGKWTIKLGLNTSYILSTTERSDIYNDHSTGRQIPYTPRYNGQLNVGVTWRGLTVNYNQTYTGYRFTTTDESEYLAPYATGNFQVMYGAVCKKHSLQLFAALNNAWNEHYEVVARRPMPGTNWQAGLKVSLVPADQ